MFNVYRLNRRLQKNTPSAKNIDMFKINYSNLKASGVNLFKVNILLDSVCCKCKVHIKSRLL